MWFLPCRFDTGEFRFLQSFLQLAAKYKASFLCVPSCSSGGIIKEGEDVLDCFSGHFRLGDKVLMVYTVILTVIQHAFNELLCISDVQGAGDAKMNETQSLFSHNLHSVERLTMDPV